MTIVCCIGAWLRLPGELFKVAFSHLPLAARRRDLTEVMSRQIEGMLDKASWSLRALGVTTCERAQRLPRLPPFVDTPPSDETRWFHRMRAPHDTPKDGVDHLTSEINAARSDPTIS